LKSVLEENFGQRTAGENQDAKMRKGGFIRETISNGAARGDSTKTQIEDKRKMQGRGAQLKKYPSDQGEESRPVQSTPSGNGKKKSAKERVPAGCNT